MNFLQNENTSVVSTQRKKQNITGFPKRPPRASFQVFFLPRRLMNGVTEKGT